MQQQPLTLDELREQWHLDLVLAYVRGRLPELPGPTNDGPYAVLRAAREHGLNLDPFKRSRILPRVQAVLAIIRSFAPSSLVDLGTGRGRLLWQLLEALPDLEIVTVDREPEHVQRIEAMRIGGIARVRGIVADVERVPLPARSADGVTALEILEHAAQPEQVVHEALRLARRFLIISVPSDQDENPEHVRHFDAKNLERLVLRAGARRVTIQQVPGHYVALVDARGA